MKDWLPVLIAVLFPIYFIGMWCFVLWVISRIGGWARLASLYPAGARPEGLHLGWRSMQIRPFANYSSCLNVTLAHEGIYMIPVAIFRLGHRPLLIPWTCVGPLEEKTILFRYYLLPMEAGGKHIRLSVPVSAKEWIATNRN